MRGALGIERLAWLFQLKGCERGCIVGRCSSGYLRWCAACKIYACLSNVKNCLVIDAVLVDTGGHKLAIDIGGVIAECYGFAVLDIGFCQYLGILVENRRLCQNLYLDNVLQLGIGRNGDASTFNAVPLLGRIDITQNFFRIIVSGLLVALRSVL